MIDMGRNMNWCKNQMLDERNQVMCLAHLAEGRVLSCPYKSNLERENDKYPCVDYGEITHEY